MALSTNNFQIFLIPFKLSSRLVPDQFCHHFTLSQIETSKFATLNGLYLDNNYVEFKWGKTLLIQ